MVTEKLIKEGQKVLSSRIFSGSTYVYDHVNSLLYQKWVLNCLSFLKDAAPEHVEHIRDIYDNQYPFYHSAEKIFGIVLSADEVLRFKSESSSKDLTVKEITKKIFIVHGKDNEIKETVARCIEKLELEPVILHEQPSRGKTIIEKLEAHTEVDFAVVLLTPDDETRSDEDSEQFIKRARQNVIFELGLFIGVLGRNRVCALYKEGVDIPSDYKGVIYIKFDEAGAWKFQLAQEIKEIIPDLDLNNLTK